MNITRRLMLRFADTTQQENHPVPIDAERQGSSPFQKLLSESPTRNPTVEADNQPWAAVQGGYRVRGRPYGENGDWVCFLRRYSRRFAARLVLPP